MVVRSLFLSLSLSKISKAFLIRFCILFAPQRERCLVPMDVKNLSGILPIDESLYSSYSNTWASKFSANARSFWNSNLASTGTAFNASNPLNAVVPSTPSTTNSSLANNNSLINSNASNANQLNSSGLNAPNMISNTFGSTTNNLMNGFFNSNYPYSSANTSGLNSGLNSSFTAAAGLSSMKSSLSQLTSSTEKIGQAKAN